MSVGTPGRTRSHIKAVANGFLFHRGHESHTGDRRWPVRVRNAKSFRMRWFATLWNSTGTFLERMWPKPVFTFVKPGRKPKAFPVRNKQVRKDIFERLKRQIESEENGAEPG